MTALRQGRKLIDRVLAPHGPVAFCTNGPEIVQVGRPPFTFWDVVPHLESKRRNEIFAPRNHTLVLKEPVAKVQKPHLLSKRQRNLLFHVRLL